LGVRLAKIDAEYVRPPSLQPVEGGAWREATDRELEPAHYLIAVDEFAEVELCGNRVLTREEFRAVCDRGKTREKILKLLRARK
jgi:hypothetical protein